jgi:phosphoglycerate dehydrogenase-like enzyme
MKVVAWPVASNTQLVPTLAGLPDTEVVKVSSAAELQAAAAGVEAYVTGNMAFSPEVAAILRGQPSLRLLHFTSAGYDGLQHGVAVEVTVCNAGDAWSVSVAEHAMMLLLALSRQLPAALAQQQERRWDKAVVPGIRSLDGQTLAVVGLGSIGKAVARRARAFGMRVLGVSRSGAADPAADEVHAAAALHDVLARADAVVIATPLTAETHHLMNDASFAALKAGALFVNISRGGTVDQAALLRAVERGSVAAAGLDVTDPEPLPPESPLWDRPEILITPHVASVSGEHAKQRLADMVRDNIAAFRSGAPLRNCLRDRRQG